MRAVSNTSPISNLAFIERLELLRMQFSEVWIPKAVQRELESHPDPGCAAAIQTALDEGWNLIKMSNRHLS